MTAFKKDIKASGKPKEQYRVRNWAEYDHALVSRGSLFLWFEDGELARQWTPPPNGKRGAQPKYSDLAIQTVLTLKAVFGLRNRSVEGFVNSIFTRLGYALTSPDHTLISRRAKTLTVQIPRRQRGQNGPELPLHVVIDSTGLKVFGEGEWKVRQHGVGKRRTWRKVHLGVDALSGEVLAVEITSADIHDADCIEGLLEQMDAPVEQISADGAYDKRKVYESAAVRSIKLVTPPQDGAAHWEAGHPRNTAIEKIQTEGYEKWRDDTGYGLRAMAENAMFRLKTLFGEHLSARLPETQTAEVHVRVAAMNIMTALGMPQSVRLTPLHS